MTGANAVFVARAWVQSRVKAWLASSDPVLVLTGPPGSGKSTLVSRVSGIGVRPDAVHTCRGRQLSTTEPLPVLASLATALARRVPGYAETVIRRQPGSWRDTVDRLNADGPAQVGMAVLDSADSFVAFERGLRHPLSTLAAAGELSRDLVVVIDGLDEVSLHGRGNELADMLGIQAQRAVPGLRLLITTRPGPTVDKLRTAPRLSLDEDPSTVDTIASALASGSSLSQRTRRAIAKATQGNFVHAMLAARSADLAKGAPAGLDTLYRLVLDGPAAAGADLLGAVCRGRDNGLSPATLAGILQVDRRDIDSILAERRLVLEGSRLIRPHHRCLADHLASSAHEADGHIAAHLVEKWRGQWDECANVYALRNVLPHLADAALHEWASDKAGRSPAAAMLQETLTDPGYVSAALAAIGVDELRAALSYTRHRIAGTSVDVELVPVLDEILREQAPSLRECRSGPTVTRQRQYLAATHGAPELTPKPGDRAPSGELETLWATDDNRVIRKAPRAIRGHRLAVTALGVAANGTRAVSASLDGTTLMWRLASGRLTDTLTTTAHVAAVHSGPDAERVRAAYSDGTVHEWDLTTGSDRRYPAANVVQATAFAVANDASRAVTGDLDRAVTVWDLTNTPEPLLRLPHQPGRVIAVALSADGRHAAAACGTGDVTVWDAETGRVRMRLHSQRGVAALCLTPRGDRVAVGDMEGTTVHVIADDANGDSSADDTVVGKLATRDAVTALAANPAMSCDILLGTASGQVAYIRVP